ncbi:hypothetical protein BBJ28_00002424 [Nothophytophthora sp. Chile5]|nr:hypothetical protein BBJ28_00002424 [Nothophytophthora sp. Chile5]
MATDSQAALKGIEAHATEIRSSHRVFGADVRALAALLDHCDVLVAYAAKEALHSVLTSDDKVKELLDGEADNLQVGICVFSVFTATTTEQSVRYEALTFLSDLMKRLQAQELAEDSHLVELSQQMGKLMDDVFLEMDYASQPAFVSCVVLGLIGDYYELVDRARQGQKGGEDDGDWYFEWLQRCLVWLKQSSCTSVALRLLNSEEPSDVASQAAFISEGSRYPFLQQWLLLLSRLAVALLEAGPAISSGETPEIVDREDVWSMAQLPHRRQLFVALSEQDDVMVEVLNALLTLAGAFTDAIPTTTEPHIPRFLWPATLSVYMTKEFNPDLLFADLIDVFGRDHLVLLDLLVSSETQMLEYLLRYLRHLSESWSASKQLLLLDGRLDAVLSVLIRLRLEIDRLVAAALFPYGAKPLTRRLLTIEQLYETAGD